MKVSAYLSRFLKAADLKEPVTATINRIEAETFRGDDGEEKKLILFLDGLDQAVVLSKTMIQQLVAILGSDESDDWAGKTVTLFNDRTVSFRGKTVGGIRFRAPGGEDKSKEATPF